MKKYQNSIQKFFLSSALLFACTVGFGQIMRTIPKSKIENRGQTYNSEALKDLMASLPTKRFSLGDGKSSSVKLVNIATAASATAPNREVSKILAQDDICATVNVRLDAESESFDAPYAVSSGHIYPGAVYNYSDFYGNSVNPTSIISPRNPLTLQISSNIGSGKRVTLNDPVPTALIEATGQLKSSMPIQAPNLLSAISMTSVRDISELKFKVNASAGGYGVSVAADYANSFKSDKSYFLVDIRQYSYTIEASLPQDGPLTVFKDMALNRSKEALFISNVTYGRRVLGVLETTFASKDDALNFNAEYQGAFEAKIGYNMAKSASHAKSTLKLYFAGGFSKDVQVPELSDEAIIGTINKYLGNVTSETAVPMSFTFRNMAMQAMRYESTLDNFTYKQCVPSDADKKYTLKITLNSISNASDAIGDETIKMGLVQFAPVYSAENKLLNPIAENTDFLPDPIVCWGAPKNIYVGWIKDHINPMHVNNCQEAKIFKGSKKIDKTVTLQLTQKQITDGAYIEIFTKYLAMYATNFAGGDDKWEPNRRDKVPLAEILTVGKANKDFEFSFNGHSFVANYFISLDPVAQ